MPRPTHITAFGLGLVEAPSYKFERVSHDEGGAFLARPRIHRDGYTLRSRMSLEEARTHLTGSARGTHADAEAIREAAAR